MIRFLAAIISLYIVLMHNIALSDAQTYRNNTAILANLEELKEQMRNIRGELEQLQFENSRLNDKLIKFSSDMEFRFNELSKSKDEIKVEDKVLDNINNSLDNNVILSKNDSNNLLSNQDVSKDPILSKNLANKNIEQNFQDAYSLLKAKDYKNAQQAFESFITKNPSNPLVSSARFWLGEILFASADFEKAAIQYLKGYQSNIRGSKAPDNLLKLAKSLAKLDRRKSESCITLAKLKAEFPNASNIIKKQADDDMKNLNCINLLNKK